MATEQAPPAGLAPTGTSTSIAALCQHTSLRFCFAVVARKTVVRIHRGRQVIHNITVRELDFVAIYIFRRPVEFHWILACSFLSKMSLDQFPRTRGRTRRRSPAFLAYLYEEFSGDRSEDLDRFSRSYRDSGPKSSNFPPPITNLEHSDARTISTRFFAVERTSVLFRAFPRVIPFPHPFAAA